MAEAVTKAAPDDELILAEFPKNSREVVRVRRTVYQGRTCLDMRGASVCKMFANRLSRHPRVSRRGPI